MKNIQVIDGALNCAYDIFAAPEVEFLEIFGAGRDIAFIDEVIDRLGEDRAGVIMNALWARRVSKPLAHGVHGTLFFDLEHKKEYYPSRREADLTKTFRTG